MESQLAQLQNLFSLYQPFWTEWLAYKHCRLTKKEIVAINSLVKNQFNANTGGGMPFYISKREVQSLTSKFKTNYNHYQEWAIIRFQFVLLSYMYKEGRKLKHNLAIKDLPLDLVLIKILLKFKSKTLEELVDTYTEKEFQNELIFAYILKFMARYLKLNLITHEPAGV